MHLNGSFKKTVEKVEIMEIIDPRISVVKDWSGD